MHLSITSLPPVLELGDNSGIISLVPDNVGLVTEEQFVVTAASISPADSGMVLDFVSNPTALTLSGRYEEQFAHTIKFNKPQVDDYTAPESVTTTTWADVPDPGDPGIWFLYEYTPPGVMTKTVTYTIQASWNEVDATIPPGTTTPRTGTFTATQVVNYDTDTNVAEFKRYYP